MDEQVLKTVIQVRRDTHANWELNKDAVPAEGEPCLDLDTGLVKYGDGVTTYENLPVSGGHASHYEGVKLTGETDNDTINRVLTDANVTPNKDDIFVVKSLIADGKYAYTAFVYDGAVWAAMDGNYSADNVYFPNDLVFTYQFGKYVPQNGKVSVPAGGMNVSGMLSDAFAEDILPAVTAPSVTLASSQVKAYEVGTSVTPAYTATFNPGAYEFDESTGVAVSSWSVTDTNGGSGAAASGTFAAFTVEDATSYSITATATYGDGAVPKTALGNDCADKQIVAGTVSATKGTITGYRNGFFGALTDKTGTINSALVRSISGTTNKTPTAGTVMSVSIPVGATRVVFAYPATLRDVNSVQDVNGMNAEIKSAFTCHTVSVEGANGYSGIDYKVYVMDMAAANDTANTYKVTI